MRLLRTLAVGLLSGALLAMQSGCLVVAAAAGTGAAVAYVRGDTEANLEGNPGQVVAAANAALKEDLKLALVSSSVTSLDGTVIARTADDTKVDVTIKSTGDKSSNVSVRIGTFGDQALSAQILEKIKARLGSSATTQPV